MTVETQDGVAIECRGDSFTPFPRVLSRKGQDEGTPNGREKTSRRTLSPFRAPVIMFAPLEQQPRCHSRGVTCLTPPPTMRESYVHFEMSYCAGGVGE